MTKTTTTKTDPQVPHVSFRLTSYVRDRIVAAVMARIPDDKTLAHHTNVYHETVRKLRQEWAGEALPLAVFQVYLDDPVLLAHNTVYVGDMPDGLSNRIAVTGVRRRIAQDQHDLMLKRLRDGVRAAAKVWEVHHLEHLAIHSALQAVVDRSRTSAALLKEMPDLRQIVDRLRPGGPCVYPVATNDVAQLTQALTQLGAKLP